MQRRVGWVRGGGCEGVGVGDRGCGVHGVNVAVDWNH